MKILHFFFYVFALCFSLGVSAQEVINTSFEDYTSGNINGQNKWTVSKGSATAVNDVLYSHTGNYGLKFINTSAFQADHIGYTATQTGLSGDVYVDFWIKINSLTTASFSITGYDLSTNSRSFMLEFVKDGKIKVYSGSSGSTTIKPDYSLNQWNRLSFKISNTTGTYQFALNGNPYADVLPFREIKNAATTFYYHSIRFIQASDACDVAIDDMYIGSNPISDITFGETIPGETKEYTFSIVQPANGVISVSPEAVDGKYKEGTKVTANITVNDLCRFKFNKWTNDVSGTSSPVTFTVTKNMTIGAEIVDVPETATIKTVNNYNELKSALAAMNPGDVIKLSDGEYSGNALTVTQSGCEERPIIIRAKNTGKAKLTGKLYFTLKQINYVTFEGLNFDLDGVASIFKMEGCSYVRITRNEFRMKKDSDTQTSKWILIGDVWDNVVCTSHHNRIDHNLFDGKYDGGSWLVIDGAHGTSPGDISKYDRIDHNHFRNNTPRVANEKETVRVGVSDLTPCSAYCIVENNLFENCDGDPEVVSIKSCDNIVRGNTFRGCLGTVCLRQGKRNTVDGNYFFGDGKTVDGNGCGGIRVYGIDHKIINNYFEGLTGEKWDAACTITNGDVTNSTTSWSSHCIPENVVFAFNTYVNNKSDIEIGFTNEGNYGKAPVNNLIANNIFIQDANPIVKVHTDKSLSGVSFANNIMYASNSGSIGTTLNESQAKQVDPLLVQSDCVAIGASCSAKLPVMVYKLAPNSPAVDAATVHTDLSTTDFEGQERAGLMDIGADEYSVSPILNGVLTAEHVGPDAVDFQLLIPLGVDSENNTDKAIVRLYSFNKQVQVQFLQESDEAMLLNVYDAKGTTVGSVSSASQTVDIPLSNCSKGVYILKISNTKYKQSLKFILD